jgi:hypothetical protein
MQHLVVNILLAFSFFPIQAQPGDVTSVIASYLVYAKPPAFVPSPIIDFNAYLKLATEVQQIRQSRLVSLDTFMHLGSMDGVVILDTRSDSLYNAKHIAGAIHLNFADFTQEALEALIPDKSTKILIYCNNNFKEIQLSEIRIEPAYFSSKAIRPTKIVIKEDAKPVAAADKRQVPVAVDPVETNKPLSLALNIPTFINLVGYGYANVYELGEQVFVFDPRLKFEGTAVNN